MSLLDNQGFPIRGNSGQRVVAFGGGHGLSATLKALRHLTHQLTAVVTVADDGGSSGRLREEMEILPPGDLRMALASLCHESEWGLTWRDLMQHRFETDGPLNGHALGNLLITGLWQMFDDPVEGLDWVARLLQAHGRVLPMSLDPLQIEATIEVEGRLEVVRGQTEVATVGHPISEVRLIPDHPRVPKEVIRATQEAEWVVLGPGSWYSSVLPHLLVSDLHRALVTTEAHRALIMNLARQEGETELLSTADHIRVLYQMAPDFKLDVVIADPTAVDDVDDLVEAAELVGARLLLRQVRSGSGAPIHDPLRLAAALRDAFEGYLGEVGKTENWLA
ncbi:uridine diphosphate-N-acetylglucosamine-binding protein YvcK [Actinomyces sp. F1_1611]